MPTADFGAESDVRHAYCPKCQTGRDIHRVFGCLACFADLSLALTPATPQKIIVEDRTARRRRGERRRK